MKILHTADWHLGKTINGLSREDEQKKIMEEICEIAERKNVNAVLIAGDIFSGINTPSYADELFIDTVIRLSDSGKRAVIAIAGNCDEGTRFAASRKFAEKNNIFLIKNTNYEADTETLPEFNNINLSGSGKGYLKFKKGNEVLTIAYMPYPSQTILAEIKKPELSINEKAKTLLNYGGSMFEENGINITLTHLFIKNPKFDMDFFEEFSEDIIPKKTSYAALGHIYDQTETREGSNFYYAGSTIISSAREEQVKKLIILNTENNVITSKEFIKLKSPIKIKAFTVNSYADAAAKLNSLSGSYAELTFNEDAIKPEEIEKLKSEYQIIVKFNIKPNMKKKKNDIKSLRVLSSKDIFKKFYEKEIGVAASERLSDVFLEVLSTRGDENESY